MGGRKKTSAVGRGERKPVLSAKVLRGIRALTLPGVVSKICDDDDGADVSRFGEPDARDVSDAKRALQFADETTRFRSKDSQGRRGRA